MFSIDELNCVMSPHRASVLLMDGCLKLNICLAEICLRVDVPPNVLGDEVVK